MNFIKSLYIGMQNKYNNETSNFKGKQSYTDNCLKFDRILDAENQIYVGIGTRRILYGLDLESDISLQVIRIGDYTNKYYRLLNFTEKENKLKYEFENDIMLILKKINENNIQLELFDLNNNRFISKEIDPVIIKNFKTIHLLSISNELDKIYELFNNIK
jgi:hypothetical protein